jgi:hypothetical protein
MGSENSERGRARPSATPTRSLVEIIAVLAASTIMALMVVGGGIATERMADGQTSATEDPSREPAPLSWREST